MPDPGRLGAGSLRANQLTKNIRGKPIVREVSLSLDRGEIVGLLGPNGAGKTTCFYAIAGLLAPDSGDVIIDGQDATHLPMYRRARLGLGYLPQEISIFRGLSVEDNILSVLEIWEPDKAERRERLEELLADFSISHVRATRGAVLSGGERRRAEIARCLAARPNYVLLDEPFAGIDPIAVGDIRKLVGQLKNRNIGILITDHNARDTLALVDRAYVMHEGAICAEGAPDEILTDPTARNVYLGHDFPMA